MPATPRRHTRARSLVRVRARESCVARPNADLTYCRRTQVARAHTRSLMVLRVQSVGEGSQHFYLGELQDASGVRWENLSSDNYGGNKYSPVRYGRVIRSLTKKCRNLSAADFVREYMGEAFRDFVVLDADERLPALGKFHRHTERSVRCTEKCSRD